MHTCTHAYTYMQEAFYNLPSGQVGDKNTIFNSQYTTFYMKLSYEKVVLLELLYKLQEGQRCPKRRVAQAAIRLATAVITFRNKERNVRSPS